MISQINGRARVVQETKQELQQEETRQGPYHNFGGVPTLRIFEEPKKDIQDGQNGHHYIPSLSVMVDEVTQTLAEQRTPS